MPTDAEKYRILTEYLPSDIILDDKLLYCHMNSSEQTKVIDELRKALVAEKIIINQPSYLLTEKCMLEPTWAGSYDFTDTEDENKSMSKPSIGWTCQPTECHIETDLPVPANKLKSMINDVKKINHCCVSEVHTHTELHTEHIDFPAEKHTHIVCKGVHPTELGFTVNQLVKAVLKNRGHKIDPITELRH